MGSKFFSAKGESFLVPKFHLGTFFVPAKFYFALNGSRRRKAVEAALIFPRPHGRGYGIGHEMASASAFPNEIWERGKMKVLHKL